MRNTVPALALSWVLLSVASASRADSVRYMDDLRGLNDRCGYPLRYLTVPSGTWLAGSVGALQEPNSDLIIAAEKCSSGLCIAGLILGFDDRTADRSGCDDSSSASGPLRLTTSLDAPPEAVVELYLRDPVTGDWWFLAEFTGQQARDPVVTDLAATVLWEGRWEIVVLLIYPEPTPCPTCGSDAIAIRRVTLGPPG